MKATMAAQTRMLGVCEERINELEEKLAQFSL
jgi:hypothetical protein